MLYQMLFALVFSQMSLAQEVTVTATVDRSQMRLGDTFTYTISISSEESVSFENPNPPATTGLELLNNWTSSGMKGSFVNGQVQTQREQSFHFQMAATTEGKIVIGPAEVVVNGVAKKTNSVEIVVSSAGVQAPGGQGTQAPPDPMDPFADDDDIFSQLLRRHLGRRAPRLQPTDPDSAYFIQAQVDKTKVFAGEQVNVAFYLVSRGQILDIDTLKYPTLKGFWKEDIEVATRLNFQPEVINGIQYQKALLASYALFPIKSGTSVVDSYVAKCRVLITNNMGMPQELFIEKQSDEIKISVDELPSDKKPSTFGGGVGQFTINSSVDSTSTQVGVPIVYKVRIEGVGNAKFVELPKITLNDGSQIYEPKSSMKFFNNGRSFKQFEVLINPKSEGELVIPAIEMHFFNPATKSYYAQQTSEHKIQVGAGSRQGLIPSLSMNVDKTPAKEEVLVMPGLVDIVEDSKGMSLAQQMGLWTLFFAVTGLGFGLQAYREFSRNEVRVDLKRKIQVRMSSIEAHAKNNLWRKVGIELTSLISSVLGEISGQGGGSFEFDVLVEKSPPSFRRDVAPSLRLLLEKLQILAFAPDEAVGSLKKPEELKNLIAQSENLLLKAARYDFMSATEEK